MSFEESLLCLFTLGDIRHQYKYNRFFFVTDRDCLKKCGDNISVAGPDINFIGG